MEEHGPKELSDQVRDAIRVKHYSYRTEQAYVGWIKRYTQFHDVRHPSEMGAAEVEAFLIHLAVKEHVAASTQNQALSASFSSIARCSTRSWVPWTHCATNVADDCPQS